MHVPHALEAENPFLTSLFKIYNIFFIFRHKTFYCTAPLNDLGSEGTLVNMHNYYRCCCLEYACVRRMKPVSSARDDCVVCRRVDCLMGGYSTVCCLNVTTSTFLFLFRLTFTRVDAASSEKSSDVVTLWMDTRLVMPTSDGTNLNAYSIHTDILLCTC